MAGPQKSLTLVNESRQVGLRCGDEMGERGREQEGFDVAELRLGMLFFRGCKRNRSQFCERRA